MHKRQHAHTDTGAHAPTIMTFCFECEAVECSFHLFFPPSPNHSLSDFASPCMDIVALGTLVSGVQHWQSLLTLVFRLQQCKIQTHKRFRRILFIRMKTACEKSIATILRSTHTHTSQHLILSIYKTQFLAWRNTHTQTHTRSEKECNTSNQNGEITDQGKHKTGLPQFHSWRTPSNCVVCTCNSSQMKTTTTNKVTFSCLSYSSCAWILASSA